MVMSSKAPREPISNGVAGFAKGMIEWMGDVISPVSEPWAPGNEAELFELSPAPKRRRLKR